MTQSQQRYVRLRDAPAYLGMDKNLFNKVVRPALIAIPIGKRGIAFDRLDLDAWADHYKQCNGRPVSKNEGGDRWDVKEHRDYKKLAVSGTSIRESTAADFVKAALPEHLREMALFAVNTGCRDQEVCWLCWEWEVKVSLPEMGSVFIIPSENVKNGEDRLVVLNRVACAVIERQRGKHPEFVFVYRGHPVTHMLNNGWRKARQLTELPVRVHDLKHTYGRRLRSAGVSFEDRQDLLGHKSARITTHYSSAELLNLWKAANKVCEGRNNSSLTLLRQVQSVAHEKVTKPMLRVVESGAK